MAIAFVQKRDQTGGTGTTVNFAYTSNNTAGNMLVASTTWIGAAPRTCVVSDSQGNSWVTLTKVEVPSTAIRGLILAYAFNCAAGANTVTFTYNSTNTYSDQTILEYSGSMDAIDKTASAPSSTPGTALSSGNVVTGFDDELLIAYGADEPLNTWTAGAGWTLRSTSASRFNAVADQLDKAAGTYAGTFTIGSSQHWAAGIATFYDSTPDPPPSSGSTSHQQLRKWRG